MQGSMAAVSILPLLLLTAIPITLGSQAAVASSSGGPYQPTECCFKFATRVLPLRLIDTFYKTSSQCSRPGIIFITKRGNLICANPSDSWVQKHIKNLKE